MKRKSKCKTVVVGDTIGKLKAKAGKCQGVK